MALRALGRTAALSLILLGGLAPALPARSQAAVCFDRESTFARLARNYGEVPAFRGVTSGGQLFEVLVGPGGSFTVFVSFPDGTACPTNSGDGWRPVPAPAAPLPGREG